MRFLCLKGKLSATLCLQLDNKQKSKVILEQPAGVLAFAGVFALGVFINSLRSDMSGVFGGLAGVLSIFLNPFISGVFSGVAPLGVPLGENMRLTPRISGVFCWPSEVNGQVWPLTQFFLFPFCKKSLVCLEGKSMTP